MATKSHPLHRKEAIHAKVIKSRRFWRWFIKLNKLCLELGLEVTHERG